MKATNIIIVKNYASPYGGMLLGSMDDQLCLCDWQQNKHRDTVDRRLQKALSATFEEGTSKAIENAEQQLDEYFAGKRQVFDLPLLMVGSDLQKRVWNELLTIPYGKTITYKELAQRLDRPKAVRAVANAVGTNGMSILIPCHRVIGSDHSMTGYAGGIDAKLALLKLEGAL